MVAKKKSESKKEDYNALRWERESAWHKLTKKDSKSLQRYCSDYMAFLSLAKTEMAFNEMAVAMLEEAGFQNLDEIETTEHTYLQPGDKVYRNWRGRNVIAFHIGNDPYKNGMHMLGGHMDSPRLDLKPNPVYEDGDLGWLDTHYYGGIKKYQWVTMPLAMHGQICLENGDIVNIKIGEDPSDPVFVITDVLPHLGKGQAGKKISEAITGENLNVLIGSVPVDDKDAKEKIKANLLHILNKRYDIIEEDFASADVELVPAGQARELGLDESMMLGYGHDDRVCSYACLRALLELNDTPEKTAVMVLSDKEEIGSVGATGMESTVFENTVADVINRMGSQYSDIKLRKCLERSRMISADVNAAHDANYADVSSPNNMAKLNAGVVLTKYGGARGKSHSSEASAAFMALIRRIFNDNMVAWQTGELGKVDEGGGGTIAMFLARYGMDVVDCGPAVLSMHAPWEVAGKLDAYMAFKAYKAFLEAKE